MLNYTPPIGLTRKRKRQIKKAQKKNRKPSKIYFAAYVAFFIGLLLYKYIGFVGLIMLEAAVIGAGFWLSRNEIRLRKNTEKASGMKALNIMSDADFKLAIINKYYSDDTYECLDKAEDFYTDRDMSHFGMYHDKDNDKTFLLACFRSPEYITIRQMDEILDMRKHFETESVMLYTNGYVGDRASVLMDENIKYKDRKDLLYEYTKEDVKNVQELIEFSYVKSCPYCGGRLTLKPTPIGEYYFCTSPSCRFKVRKSTLQ